MPPSAIVREAQHLDNFSDRLDSLAGQHPIVSDALITISGSVRSTATLLEVLSQRKRGRSPDEIQQMPDLRIAI